MWTRNFAQFLARRAILRLIVLAALLVPIALVVVVSVLVTLWGEVYGVEFSPQSFRQRAFIWYEVPLVGIQITELNHIDETSACANYLAANKLLGGKAQETWQLLAVGRTRNKANWSDAQILLNYLEAKAADGDSVWQAWSEKHPELARELWPVVAQVAERELYPLLPELMELARTANSPDELRQALAKFLARECQSLADQRRQAGDEAAAAKLAEAAGKWSAPTKANESAAPPQP